MLKQFTKQAIRKGLAIPRRAKEAWQATRIRQILASDGSSHAATQAEADFDTLQKWPKRPEYGYDPYSTWQRAATRTMQLLQLDQCLERPGCSILDVGTGDGMLGVTLESYGHKVTLTDLEDWRDSRAKSVPFMPANCCIDLPFAENTFDLICSYNSFEHLPDPEGAFQQISRVLRPGGLIYLEFGPLYNGPWGLHAYRMLPMPYPQHLFSDEFIKQKLAEFGIRDLGKSLSELQFLNKWKVANFDKLWNTNNCVLVKRKVGIDRSGLSLVMRYPDAFRGKDLTLEDLTSTYLMVTLQKKDE